MPESWTKAKREAARAFIAEVMPNNPAQLVANIEDFMPPTFRRGFEELFTALERARSAEVDPWVVWSGAHASWWGPERKGYTQQLEHAGVYSIEEAKAIAGMDAIGRKPNVAMSRTDAQRFEMLISVTAREEFLELKRGSALV